jgi:predicted SAM-dependent methyltransferase
MRMMFGDRMTEYDVHLVGLNFELFGGLLNEAGFCEIRRVPEFGLFQDTSTLKFGDVPISLNMEARK